MKASSKKYNNVVVFSGGGTRFAMYCGMYAALEDFGHKPDLIIASCGGAMASCIINSFETNKQRLEYLQSDEFYKFTISTQLTKERKLYRIGLLCLRLQRNKKNAPYIENIFDRYLVDIPQDISTSVPSLSTQFGNNINSIIVGSKVLFQKSEVGVNRGNKKLYRKVLFTDKTIQNYIETDESVVLSPNYYNGAIDLDTEVLSNVSITTAARISISDMFYLQPVLHDGYYFSGGAIDLIPIELAKSLGDNIFVEKKNLYTKYEEAFVRGVFGYSGNERLGYVNTQSVDKWIDTRDATEALSNHYCRKSISLAKMEINMSMPKSKKEYQNNVQVLWNYGYLTIKKALNR